MVKCGYVQHYQNNCRILVDFQTGMNIGLSASVYLAIKTQTAVMAMVDFLLKQLKQQEFCAGLWNGNFHSLSRNLLCLMRGKSNKSWKEIASNSYLGLNEVFKRKIYLVLYRVFSRPISWIYNVVFLRGGHCVVYRDFVEWLAIPPAVAAY